MMVTDQYPEKMALKVWQVDDLTLSIVRHTSLGHLCGYVRFPARPTIEQGSDGILRYVPVHGGITYAKESDDSSMVYGFDCGHSGDAPPPEFQRYGRDDGYVWTEDEVTAETERMARAIKAAVPYEQSYLLAPTSEAKAEILDNYHAKLKEQGISFDLSDNFGAMISALSGSL